MVAIIANPIRHGLLIDFQDPANGSLLGIWDISCPIQGKMKKLPHGINKTSRLSLIAGMLSVASWLIVLLGVFTPYLGKTFFIESGMITISIAISIIAAITAITAGIVSMVQIMKSGEAGKGFAITGIVLGVPCVLFLLLALINR